MTPIPDVSPETSKQLTRAFDSLEELRNADREELEDVHGVGESTGKRFAEWRQEYPVPNDLTFQRTSVAHENREMRLEQLERAQERKIAELMGGQTVPMETDGGTVKDYKPPKVLREWLEYTAKKRQNLLECLSDIEREEITSRKSLSNYTGIPEGTLARHLSEQDALGACVEKEGGIYKLTPIGEKALEIQWGETE